MLNRRANTLNTGFLLGAGAAVAPLALMNAIFWGEASGAFVASALDVNRGAARAVCAFSVLYAGVVGLAFLPLLVRGREEFADGAQSGGGGFDNVGPTASLAGADYGGDPAATKYHGSDEAADL